MFTADAMLFVRQTLAASCNILAGTSSGPVDLFVLTRLVIWRLPLL